MTFLPEAKSFRQYAKNELESIYMWNSTAAKRSPWLTTAFLAGLLSLGLSAGSAFAQDTQDAPPPPHIGSATRSGAWDGAWAIVRWEVWTIRSSI